MVLVEFSQLIYEIVVPAIAALLSAVLAWGIPALFTAIRGFLEARVDNETVRRVLDEVTRAVEVAVKETAQIAVNDLKAAASDGKLTREEAVAALNKAVASAWGSLTQQARERLLGELGSEAAVHKFLESQVEAELAVVKALPKAAPIVDEGERAKVVGAARGRLGLR